MKRIPTLCPSCDAVMHVRQIRCGGCDTEIVGDYAFPLITRLNEADQDFIVRFMLASGSLKEMASQLGVSYPTVRNRLDDIITRIRTLQEDTRDE